MRAISTLQTNSGEVIVVMFSVSELGSDDFRLLIPGEMIKHYQLAFASHNEALPFAKAMAATLGVEYHQLGSVSKE